MQNSRGMLGGILIRFKNLVFDVTGTMLRNLVLSINPRRSNGWAQLVTTVNGPNKRSSKPEFWSES